MGFSQERNLLFLFREVPQNCLHQVNENTNDEDAIMMMIWQANGALLNPRWLLSHCKKTHKKQLANQPNNTSPVPVNTCVKQEFMTPLVPE